MIHDAPFFFQDCRQSTVPRTASRSDSDLNSISPSGLSASREPTGRCATAQSRAILKAAHVGQTSPPGHMAPACGTSWAASESSYGV
jgi:hypothetical protein